MHTNIAQNTNIAQKKEWMCIAQIIEIFCDVAQTDHQFNWIKKNNSTYKTNKKKSNKQ